MDLSRKTRNQINEALALRSIGVGNHFLDRYDITKEYYESIDAYESALDYFKLYSVLNDSMYNEETSKQITAMQTLYETEKKDKEIQLQKAEIKGNEAELRRRNIQRYALLGGITLVLLLMAVLYRS